MDLANEVATRWLPNKLVRGSVAFSVVVMCYAFLFALNAKDYYFPVAGGFVGSSSAVVVIVGNYMYGNTGSSFRLLLWRALCDLAIGLRFILIPALNFYLCGEQSCQKGGFDQSKCAFPSVWLEFFIIASETWFLCNGLDLYYTITNPFSSFQSRLKTYHIYAWVGASVFSVAPFVVNQFKAIYGYWYVSDDVDTEATCWLKIENDNRLGFSIWMFFLCPLMAVYLLCVLSLWIAYNRLRKGLTKTFLPRLKLLVTNTANVFVLALYWLVFLLVYAVAFFLRTDGKVNATFWNILNFTFASKGFSSLVVWIAVSDPKTGGMKSDDGDETIDANKSLREEVLQYATAGIRSTARAGPTVLPSQDKTVRRPPVQRERGQQMITPMFFLRFMVGEAAEFKAIQTMASNKRSSTGIVEASRLTTTSQAHREGSLADIERLSQRSTIVTVSDRHDYNSGDFDKSPRLDRKIVKNLDAERDLSASETSSEFRPQYTTRSISGVVRDDFDGPEVGRAMSEASIRVSDMVEPTSIDGYDIDGMKVAPAWDIWTRTSNYLQSLYSTSDIVEFTEFQPYHFRRVRLSAGINDETYINEFSTTIKERLTQGGASGAFFFFSKGENFIAKSCTKEEAQTLEVNAAKYADYMCKNKKSYISKILGAYKLQIYGNLLYFFVMNNLFFNNEGLTMNEKYDIKGSWVSRNAEPPVDGQSVTCSYCEQKFVYKKYSRKTTNTQSSRTASSSHKSANASRVAQQSLANGIELNDFSGSMNSTQSQHVLSPFVKNLESMEDNSSEVASEVTHGQNKDSCPYTVSGHHEPNLILKDNDIKYKIRLPPDTTQELFNQMKSDAEFLYSLGIMDYSLLVGVHNTEYIVKDDDTNVTGLKLIRASTIQNAESLQSYFRGASSQPRETDMLSSSTPSFAHNENSGGISLAQKLEVYRVVGPDSYFIGIIDFQQQWNLKKKMERFFKVNFKGADPNGLSAIEPKTYRDRFLRKIEDILDFESFNRIPSGVGSSSQG